MDDPDRAAGGTEPDRPRRGVAPRRGRSGWWGAASAGFVGRLLRLSERMRTLPVAVRYGLACLTVLATFGLCWAAPDLPGAESFLPFLPAVILNALVLNHGSGIVSAVLGATLAVVFFVEPVGAPTIAEPGKVAALGVYALVGALIAAVIEELHKTYHAMTRAGAERDKAERRQRVLISELQHRTRNLLAVVGQVAEQTAAGAAGAPGFIERFRPRLAALSRAQDVLGRRGGEAADLADLIRGELAAHGAGPDDARVTLHGPAVKPRPEVAQALALAVHELATNAVKHGALGAAGGRLAVTWDVVGEGGEGWLSLEWLESGVPARAASGAPRRGYGRQLIEQDLPYELDAQTAFEIGPEGVRCTVLVPLTGHGGGHEPGR